MASIYDKASLVLIPSGTKTSKVYSQKPVSGDGDFTFSRSTAATRVNADGNIEKETQNLLLQSNSFDTTWLGGGLTKTSGQSGYDGSSDAWLIENISSGSRFLTQTGLGSGVATFSIYAKAGTTDWILLNNGLGGYSYFDLTNGIIGASTAIDSQINAVGATGWYRCSIAVSNANEVRYYLAVGNNSPSTAVGDNIYIQDAQLEQGLVARDYIETTTAAVEGGITDNVPRLDYTDSSCPALLLEPQRTNVIDYSELFTSASTWGVINISTRTANYGTSPEGVQNSTRLVLNNTTDAHIFRNAGGLADGTDYVFSCWYKGTAGQTAYIRAITSGTNNTSSYKLITFTGEWQREFTAFKAGSTYNYVYPVDARAGSMNASDFEIFGAQLEAGSYATSYIPTYGSSVSRVNDMASIIPVSSSVIDTSKAHSGFIEIKSNGIGLSYQIFGIDDNSYNNFIKILQNSSQTNHRLYSRADGGSYLTSSYGTSGQYNKYAWTYDGAGTLKYFINGSLDSTHSATFPVMSSIGYGERSGATNYVAHSTNQILLFNQALTDQEAIDLTTI